MASSSTKKEARTARSPESFESSRQREGAAEILQSYERLSWFASRRCETIAQTRMHFQGLVAGFTEEDTDKRRLWREDFTPHPSRQGQESTSSRKGKDRVSMGSEIEQATKTESGSSRDQSKAKQKQKSTASEPMGKSASASERGVDQTEYDRDDEDDEDGHDAGAAIR